VNRLLVPALLRPFGEHLVAMLAPQPDDVCVTLGDEFGVMSALLARVAPRECIALDDATELPDGGAQVITSLFAPLTPATLDELLRILDPHRGRIACAVFAELIPGIAFGAPLDAANVPPALALTSIRDVARFDGVNHFAAAMDVNEFSPETAKNLAVHTAPDGTLRIPVEATVVMKAPARTTTS
jgi:hypothetical protein